MTMGRYYEGKTPWVVEAKTRKGRVVYRKFTDDERISHLFGCVVDTTNGITFEVRGVTHKDKNMPIMAHPKVLSYLSRELAKLQGIYTIAAQEQNLANRSRKIKEVTPDRIHRIPDPLIPEIDPQNLPGELQPVRQVTMSDAEIPLDDFDEEELQEVTADSGPAAPTPNDDLD